MKCFLPRILDGSVMSLQGSRISLVSLWAPVPVMLSTQPSALPAPKGLSGARLWTTNTGSDHAQTFSPRRRRTSISANSSSPAREQVLASPQGLGQDMYLSRGSHVCMRLLLMATGRARMSTDTTMTRKCQRASCCVISIWT